MDRPPEPFDCDLLPAEMWFEIALCMQPFNPALLFSCKHFYGMRTQIIEHVYKNHISKVEIPEIPIPEPMKAQLGDFVKMIDSRFCWKLFFISNKKLFKVHCTNRVNPDRTGVFKVIRIKNIMWGDFTHMEIYQVNNSSKIEYFFHFGIRDDFSGNVYNGMMDDIVGKTIECQPKKNMFMYDWQPEWILLNVKESDFDKYIKSTLNASWDERMSIADEFRRCWPS